MASLEKNIGNLIPGFQSMAVLGKSLEFIPKMDKKGLVKKTSSKKLVKGFIDISVATSLISPTSEMISKL